MAETNESNVFDGEEEVSLPGIGNIAHLPLGDEDDEGGDFSPEYDAAMAKLHGPDFEPEEQRPLPENSDGAEEVHT